MTVRMHPNQNLAQKQKDLKIKNKKLRAKMQKLSPLSYLFDEEFTNMQEILATICPQLPRIDPATVTEAELPLLLLQQNRAYSQKILMLYDDFDSLLSQGGGSPQSQSHHAAGAPGGGKNNFGSTFGQTSAINFYLDGNETRDRRSIKVTDFLEERLMEEAFANGELARGSELLRKTGYLRPSLTSLEVYCDWLVMSLQLKDKQMSSIYERLGGEIPTTGFSSFEDVMKLAVTSREAALRTRELDNFVKELTKEKQATAAKISEYEEEAARLKDQMKTHIAQLEYDEGQRLELLDKQLSEIRERVQGLLHPSTTTLFHLGGRSTIGEGTTLKSPQNSAFKSPKGSPARSSMGGFFMTPGAPTFDKMDKVVRDISLLLQTGLEVQMKKLREEKAEAELVALRAREEMTFRIDRCQEGYEIGILQIGSLLKELMGMFREMLSIVVDRKDFLLTEQKNELLLFREQLTSAFQQYSGTFLGDTRRSQLADIKKVLDIDLDVSTNELISTGIKHLFDDLALKESTSERLTKEAGDTASILTKIRLGLTEVSLKLDGTTRLLLRLADSPEAKVLLEELFAGVETLKRLSLHAARGGEAFILGNGDGIQQQVNEAVKRFEGMTEEYYKEKGEWMRQVESVVGECEAKVAHVVKEREEAIGKYEESMKLLDEMEKYCEKLQRELRVLGDDKKGLEEKVHDCVKSLKKMEKALDDVVKSKEILEREVRAVAQEKETVNERRVCLELELKGAIGKNLLLTEKVKALEGENVVLRSDHRRLETELTDLRSLTEKQRGDYDSCIRGLREDIERQARDQRTLGEDLRKAKTHLEEKESLVARLTHEMKTKEYELEQLRDTVGHIKGFTQEQFALLEEKEGAIRSLSISLKFEVFLW